MFNFYKTVVLFFALMLPLSSIGQEFLEKVLEFFVIHLNKKKVETDSTAYPTKLVLAPVIGYEPATSLSAGVGAKLLFKFKGADEETRTSNMPISALYTLNNQLLLSSGYTVFFNQEKWYLKGNLEFSIFPQSYYGIGNQTFEHDEEIFTFNNYLIEPLLLKRFAKNLFIGGGIRYNIINNIELEPEGNLIRDRPSGYDGSNSAGLEVALVYDNRDNVLNPSRGHFVEFKQGFYEKMWGGTHLFRFNQIDLRTYFEPWKHRKDVIAFHAIGRFAWGDVPVAELSLLGGVESARAYREGRYRDSHSLAIQTEYRWQALERIGMVFFAEAGEVFNNQSNPTFEDLKYGAGVGIRLKIAKEENLNIRFDYGIGFGHEFDNNFYLGIAEAF